LEKTDKLIEEKKIIHGTQRWADFKKALKWIGIIIVSIIALYILHRIFGMYIFGSLFLSVTVSSVIFFIILEVPNERYIECRIEIEEDEKGNKKPRNHIFNEYKIPINMLREFTVHGSTIVKFKMKSGKTINIVEKIDLKTKTIHYPWFSGLSDWEFYIYEETFKICKEHLENQTRDLRRHEQTRELYYDVKFIEMLQDVSKEEDFKEYESGIRDRIKEIFNNEK